MGLEVVRLFYHIRPNWLSVANVVNLSYHFNVVDLFFAAIEYSWMEKFQYLENMAKRFAGKLFGEVLDKGNYVIYGLLIFY